MKKIKKLLIGTNNKGKLREICDLLPKSIKIYSTADFKLKSPKENGTSFKENSLIKSKYFSKKTDLVCLADDSGLEIDCLNKSPGIYSARWAGKHGDFNKAIKKVYIKLNKKIACVLGKVEGHISDKPIGKNGFGYDPIFIPLKKRKTFGEMKPSQKYKMDHRYQAFKKIKKFL